MYVVLWVSFLFFFFKGFVFQSCVTRGKVRNFRTSRPLVCKTGTIIPLGITYAKYQAHIPACVADYG